MFLKSIEIQNFRSISNLNVEDLGQINIFTGENNCGKTTVLESIFQLTGWKLSNLLFLNRYRALHKEINLTYFFHYLDSKNIIKLIGVFENDYARTVQIQYSETTSVWDEVHQLLESILSEDKEGVVNELKHIVNLNDASDSLPIFGKELAFPAISFPNFKVFEHGNLIESLSEMIKNKEKEKIVSLLMPFYPQIQDIEVIQAGIFLNRIDFPRLLPIELSGDGLRRILSVILAVYGVGKGGIVLIDEIENGLHFSTMPKFWRGLINAAKEMEVQLFITTHNEELLHSLKEVASEELYEPMQEKIKYYNLKRYENDEIVAYKYDFEKFGYLIENGNVIR